MSVALQPIPFSLDIDYNEITPPPKRRFVSQAMDTLAMDVVESDTSFQTRANSMQNILSQHVKDFVQSLLDNILIQHSPFGVTNEPNYVQSLPNPTLFSHEPFCAESNNSGNSYIPRQNG